MKKVAIIFIIIGIIIIVIPIIGQFYTKSNIDRIMSEYSESEYNFYEASTTSASPEEGYIQLEEAFKAERSKDFTDERINMQSPPSSIVTPAATISPTTVSAPKNTKSKTDQIILGIMKIDKIKVKTIIVEGAKPENLRSGIGHLLGTSEIGQPGNCAFAGHRSYTFGHFFNRLDELNEGDEILISTKKSDYKYKIYQILVVNPDDVSVLKGSKDNSIITLITCTPKFIATHRLIIHARLDVQKEK